MVRVYLALPAGSPSDNALFVQRYGSYYYAVRGGLVTYDNKRELGGDAVIRSDDTSFSSPSVYSLQDLGVANVALTNYNVPTHDGATFGFRVPGEDSVHIVKCTDNGCNYKELVSDAVYAIKGYVSGTFSFDYGARLAPDGTAYSWSYTYSLSTSVPSMVGRRVVAMGRPDLDWYAGIACGENVAVCKCSSSGACACSNILTGGDYVCNAGFTSVVGFNRSNGQLFVFLIRTGNINTYDADIDVQLPDGSTVSTRDTVDVLLYKEDSTFYFVLVVPYKDGFVALGWRNDQVSDKTLIKPMYIGDYWRFRYIDAVYTASDGGTRQTGSLVYSPLE